jgi:hypothetical protein
MTLATRILLAICATFRLAQLTAYDDGPGMGIKKLRLHSAEWASYPDWSSARNFYEWLHCPHCSGVWYAALATLAVFFPTVIGDLLLTWLGIAGAQSFLNGRE